MSRSYGNDELHADSIKAMLLRMAQPDLYRLNDFRVMSLPTCATERDIQKYLRKIQLEQKFGGSQANVAPRTASSPLPLHPPPDAEMIAEAQSHLADAERRLISELFWLWPVSQVQSADDKNNGAGAFHSVQEKTPRSNDDFEAATNFWTSLLERGGEERGIAAHNLAVLFHAAALDIEWNAGSNPLTSDEQKQQLSQYWSSAIKMWKRVLDEEKAWSYLTARVRALSDPRLKVGTVRYLRLNLPLALLAINASLAMRASENGESADAKRQAELMQAFAFAPEQVAEARQGVLESVRHRIRDLCVTAENDARRTPGQAMQIAERLLERARPLLMAADDLLPAGDAQRPDLLDAVALAANNAAIMKFESLSHGVKREWISLQEFFERTSRYAATQSMRSHINTSLTWVRDNIRVSDHKSCWFCGEHEREWEASIIIRMYKLVAANNWEYYDVDIPRCLRCRLQHRSVYWLTALGAIAGAVCSFLAYVALWLSFGTDIADIADGGAFACVATFAIMGGVLAYRLAAKRVPKNIEPQQHKWRFPLMLELRSKQWTHVKPS